MAGQARGGAVDSKRSTDLQRDSGGGAHKPEKSKKELDRELDTAVEDTFPASDPPATSQPTGTEPAGDPRTKP